MSWQQIKVSTQANVGTPGALPQYLVGLSDADLANLPAALSPPTILQLGLQDTGYIPVADPAPPTPPNPTVISRIDFLRRFTSTELATITASADPVVKTFLFMLTMVTAVDLTNTDTVNGVGYMASQGLLASGRPAVILTP